MAATSAARAVRAALVALVATLVAPAGASQAGGEPIRPGPEPRGAPPIAAEPARAQTAPPTLADTPAAAEGVLDAALRLAREDHPALDEAAVRAEIARLARRYRELAPPHAPAAERARAFARLLFDEEGFSVVDALDSPEALHVDTVLARRRGYCLSLSVVALAIAEEVGEPLFGVALPNHFLVRFDDGRVRRNLELTRRGAEVTDAELRARLGELLRDESIYLHSLDPDQVRSVLLHNRGFVNLAHGRSERARRDLTAAAAALPGLPEVHRNLGVLHGEQGDWDAAIAALERALALYPGDVDALVNLALCRHAQGELAAALEDAKVALVLDPTRERARELVARWEAELAAGGAHPHGSRAPDDPPPGLVPGLLGRYHAGIAFERPVAERVDRTLDFDWRREAPLRGLPRDGFSVRWDGWFEAPRAGRYKLFVVANDGVRIRLGGHTVVEHWRAVGYTSWTGSGAAVLSAGFHPLSVEYFDQSDNARLVCIVGLEGEEYPLELAEHLFHVER